MRAKAWSPPNSTRGQSNRKADGQGHATKRKIGLPEVYVRGMVLCSTPEIEAYLAALRDEKVFEAANDNHIADLGRVKRLGGLYLL